MSSGVVVDTSVWVDFFRGRNEPVRIELRRLIKSNRAILVGMVMAEILQGIKSTTERENVESHFGALPYLEVSQTTWRSAAETAETLRSHGISLPFSDVLIATLAMEHELPVYSTDPHFTQIPHLKLHLSIHDSSS